MPPPPVDRKQKPNNRQTVNPGKPEKPRTRRNVNSGTAQKAGKSV